MPRALLWVPLFILRGYAGKNSVSPLPATCFESAGQCLESVQTAVHRIQAELS